jgi:hypothetical protein
VAERAVAPVHAGFNRKDEHSALVKAGEASQHAA